MPIIVEDPRASTGRGIRSAAASISGSVKDVASNYENERKQKELEQRSIAQKKELAEFQTKEAEKERKKRFEEQLSQNKVLAESVNNFTTGIRDRISKGEQISPIDMISEATQYSKDSGVPLDKFMNAANSVYQIETQQNKREQYKQEKLDRKIKREADFLNYSTQKSRLQGDNLDDFMDISQKYQNIQDPIERFNKTNKDYKTRQASYDNFFKTLEGPTLYDRVFGGLKDSEKNRLQNSVKNLEKQGFKKERLKEDIQKSPANFTEMEIEEIVAPLSSKEKKALEKIPKAVATIGVFSSPRAVEMHKNQLQKLPNLLTDALADGGSIKLLTEELVKKLYTRKEVADALSEVVDSVDLTPYQQAEVLQIIKKPKSRRLDEIFFGKKVI